MKHLFIGGLIGGLLGSQCKKRKDYPVVLIGVTVGAMAGVLYKRNFIEGH